MLRAYKLMFLSAAAVVAAGTLSVPSALGVTAAGNSRATPHLSAAGWSTIGPVPRAKTHTAPALTSITFPGQEPEALLFWTGTHVGSGYQISYESATSLLHNQWSAPGLVAGGTAITASPPSVAPYSSTSSGSAVTIKPGASDRSNAWGRWPHRTRARVSGFCNSTIDQVIAVWNTDPDVMFSIGTGNADRTISWTTPAAIPGVEAAGSVAVDSSLVTGSVAVAYKGVGTSKVYGVVGTAVAGPAGTSPRAPASSLQWGKVEVIPGADTAAAPALAEASTGPSAGTIYAFWNKPGTGEIYRSATTDPLSSQPTWTAPVAFPSTVTTGTTTSAQPIGPDNAYPLLIVYLALHTTALQDATLTQDGTVHLQGKTLGESDAAPAQSLVVDPGIPTQTLNVAVVKVPSKAELAGHIRHCPGCGC